MTLLELTGQESGIVIYNRKDGIACNWRAIDGWPRLAPWGGYPAGSGDDIPNVEPRYVEDMSDYLYGVTFIYANDQHRPSSGRVYEFPDKGIIVLAPDDWS